MHMEGFALARKSNPCISTNRSIFSMLVLIGILLDHSKIHLKLSQMNRNRKRNENNEGEGKAPDGNVFSFEPGTKQFIEKYTWKKHDFMQVFQGDFSILPIDLVRMIYDYTFLPQENLQYVLPDSVSSDIVHNMVKYISSQEQQITFSSSSFRLTIKPLNRHTLVGCIQSVSTFITLVDYLKVVANDLTDQAKESIAQVFTTTWQPKLVKHLQRAQSAQSAQFPIHFLELEVWTLQRGLFSSDYSPLHQLGSPWDFISLILFLIKLQETSWISFTLFLPITGYT